MSTFWCLASTVYDDIIESLSGVISCPLALESTVDMIIFNDQCYDREAFGKYVSNEDERNCRYGPPVTEPFRDPRTMKEFSDKNAVMADRYLNPWPD